MSQGNHPTVLQIEEIKGPDALQAAWRSHVRQGRNLFKLLDLTQRELVRIKYAFSHGWLMRDGQMLNHLPILIEEAKKKVRGLTKREKQELAFYRDLRDRIADDDDVRITVPDIRAMVINFYQGREEE